MSGAARARNANRVRGLTLIEMLIVMVIIAILLAVALPSYREYLLKARRAECSGVLVSLANALERRFSATHTYLDASGDATFPGGGLNASCPASGGEVFYDISFIDAAATGFALRAVPVGGQAQDRCGVLTLDHLGLRGVVSDAGLTAAQCW